MDKEPKPGRGERPERERLSGRRGSTLILLAIVFAAILALGALSIDIGMMLLTKTQLQNAADSAALAGVSVMARMGGEKGDARTAAIRLAAANRAFQGSSGKRFNEFAPVVLDDGDITFPEPGVIRVAARRTEASGNPLRSYFLKVLDPKSNATIDVRATASASYMDVCGANCPKPWAPPDRWYDANKNNKYDPNNTTNKSEYYDPELTGYRLPDDFGVKITIKIRSASQSMLPSYYYAVDYPPIGKGSPAEGANRYRDWIGGCPDPSFVVEPGDMLQIEPGSMSGPTKQGLDVLFALDPKARWDAVNKKVVDSAYLRSPRIITIPLMDPSIGVAAAGPGRKKVVVAKLLSFFIESYSSANVTGRLVSAAAPGSAVPCASQTGRSFLYKVKLTE
jgi:hypothetical protein